MQLDATRCMCQWCSACRAVTCAGWAVRPQPHTSFVEGSGATGWNIGVGVAASAYLAKYVKRQKHPRKDMPFFQILLVFFFSFFLNLDHCGPPCGIGKSFWLLAVAGMQWCGLQPRS